MTAPSTPPPGQPDPAALLALGLATQAADAGASSPPPPAPADLAAEFPQLEILELIGRGGMGAVYKARQRDLDRLVALKILRPGLDADPGFADRFTREARALAQLNHPGIVTLYEFGKTAAGRYFILMEFVDGVNLRQLLAGGRLSPREALAIVPPLCDALQYAHDRGLVHRDIKPENLLIDRLGRVKIADFGIAKITTTTASDPIRHSSFDIGHSVEGAGTPAYMAPEQRDRPAEVDHRADLYALGVVFYQMLTGELPAAGQLRPPSTRVQIDVRLDEIVLRALEKDPARRYADAGEFKTQVETVAACASKHPSNQHPSGNRLHQIISSHWFRFLPVVLMLVILIGIINRNPSVPNRHVSSAQTPNKKTPSAPAQSTSSDAPVEFRAISWLDLSETRSSNAWLPNGNDAPQDEWLPPSPKPPPATTNPNTRFLSFWFSHPHVDLFSMADVQLFAPLGETDKVLFNPEKSRPLVSTTPAGRAQTTIPANTLPFTNGWLVSTTNLDISQDLPPTIIVRLRYSLGPWRTWEQISADFKKPRVLDYDIVLGTPKEDPEVARAYIEINSTPRNHGVLEQWDVVALTRDGRRLERYARHTTTQNKELTERLYFNALLSHLSAFEVRKRPIRTATWKAPLRSLVPAPQQAAATRPSVKFLCETPPLALPELAAQIRTIVERHFPSSTIEEAADRFDARFATQEFTVHTQLKTGAAKETPHVETGPSERGFILTLTRLDKPYVGAAVLPAAGEKPYWKTFTNAGFDEARSTGVHVRLSSGSRLPKAFHSELMRLIGMIHLPRRSLTDASGETLSVYTSAFLDETDLAAVEKLPRADSSSQLRLHLTGQGAFRLNQLSQLALDRRMAILVNDRLVSAPKIMAELSTDQVDISGFQSVGDEAALLAAFPGPAPKVLTSVTHQALTWLRLVDEDRYAQSWQRSASVFREAVTEDQWVNLAASTRAPLGPLVSRRLKSTEHLSTLPDTPGGPHLVMRFETRFAQKEHAVETVTFTREADGQWRASGYFINPDGPSLASDNEAAVRVNIIGAVNRPGSWLLPANPTLLDALAAAGGWTASANLKKVSLLPSSSAAHPAAPSYHDVTAILGGRAPNPALPAQATLSLPERLY